MNLSFKLRHTPKWRLFLGQWGRFEFGVSIDLRDVFVGLHWRRERYVSHDEVLRKIALIAHTAYRDDIRDMAIDAYQDTIWRELWEIYLCPIPFLVLSLRFA